MVVLETLLVHHISSPRNSYGTSAIAKNFDGYSNSLIFLSKYFHYAVSRTSKKKNGSPREHMECLTARRKHHNTYARRTVYVPDTH
jgi:hypothetical protein